VHIPDHSFSVLDPVLWLASPFWQAEGQEAGLKQAVAVAELEVRKLRNALAAKQARVAEAQRRLAAFQP
jgi:hypothetical protein